MWNTGSVPAKNSDHEPVEAIHLKIFVKHLSISSLISMPSASFEKWSKKQAANSNAMAEVFASDKDCRIARRKASNSTASSDSFFER